MSKLILYHGSPEIIQTPVLGKGKSYNDYGRGFYCTEHLELAKEWACTENTDGYANKYEIDTKGLSVLNLSSDEYTILHWLALLMKYRKFRVSTPVMKRGADWLKERFLIDLTPYDAVVGYRADDSYFSFAESFVQNGLPLRSLNEALHLGRLGTQTVLISEKSFRNLTFDGADFADKTVYYPKFIARDSNVRETYRREIRNRHSYKNDIFVLDILREEMKDNDSRIQRILSI